MAEIALGVLPHFLNIEMIFYLVIGVLMGLAFGIMPGLGGSIALALLIPLTFGMDSYSAFTLMIAAHSAVMFGGSISAILINTPGTSQNIATCFDGFPLSQQGKAGMALGAAGTSSAIGGIFGVVILILVLPVMRRIVLAFGSPEYFMICILGLTVIAAVSKGSLAKGLVAGALGLLLSFVGWDLATGQLRYTFGLLYLWDGIEFIPAVIGLFAISEAVSLLVKGKAIAQKEYAKTGKDVLEGIKSVFKRLFLCLRCSSIGTVIGMIPGVGGAVANIVAYAHAVQSSKHPEKFGKGIIEGVIAPESANNAKDGGALVPTLAFGIPGSEAMAILLGAFVLHGLAPGPEMLTKNLGVVFIIIWTIVFANFLATGIGLAFAGRLAKLTYLPGYLLSPLIFIISMLGAFGLRQNMGDVILAFIFGLFGYYMKRYRYSRAALVIGLILGEIVERNLHVSLQAYGPRFFTSPISLILIAATIGGLYIMLRGGKS